MRRMGRPLLIWIERAKELKNKIIVIVCFLLLAVPSLNFAKDKKEPNTALSANEYTRGKASLKHSKDLDNNKAHKAARRAKGKADKKAETAQRKSDVGQSGTKGQVNMKF